MRNCHRDKTLDSYLDQFVIVTFKDGDQACGKLIWVDKITPETPYKPQMYHCGCYSFYKSHVKSVKLIDTRGHMKMSSLPVWK